MTELRVSLVASPTVVSELREAVKKQDIAFSEPVASESPADALDSPIGAEELKQLTEVVIVVFKAGTASLVFAKALLDVLKARREAVVLKNPKTGAEVGRLDQNTNLQTANGAVEACSP